MNNVNRYITKLDSYNFSDDVKEIFKKQIISFYNHKIHTKLPKYNVGEEVLEKLSKTVNNFDGLSEIREGNIFVDLKNINKRQLEEIGITKIDVCPYCTVHNNDVFYSYRNENATTLRHSAVLKLG